MATPFPDVKPFPGTPNPRAVIGGNRPPLEESIVVDFDDALRAKGLIARIELLVSKAKGAGPCTDDDTAGRYADFARLERACSKAVEDEREILNRPILNAQRALKGRCDNYLSQLKTSAATVRGHLDAYHAEQRRKAAEAQRLADEQARAARAAAEAERQRQIEAERARRAAEAEANRDPENPLGIGVPLDLPDPEIELAPIEIAAPVVEAPVIRGDYGAKVVTTTVWKHEIESVRKLPDAILKHEKVVEAINKVIAAQVRGGTRELKGCRIWSEQATAVR